ncbi:adenylyl-sulfate kinase [Desulfonatronospira sp.]|uniref:adenylyl-sulfate kinase n=1 Tax=Desulfonatronospira sp. TaxID=1962951 RepID=UPI0025C4D456|nr:adenylyl-sulfate kinase [Desulfonatronospira sp.]
MQTIAAAASGLFCTASGLDGNTGRDPQQPGTAIWFTGLPGCGKSSICDFVLASLRDKGFDPVLLRMDDRRRIYFPSPQYTREEREQAYQLFSREAVEAAREGRLVLMDATAPRIEMRKMVRDQVPAFAEIHIHCTLNTAMHRERSRPGGQVMAELYDKALERKKTGRDVPGLGMVIGVDQEFEMDPEAEMILENDHLSLQEAGEKVSEFILENILCK